MILSRAYVRQARTPHNVADKHVIMNKVSSLGCGGRKDTSCAAVYILPHSIIVFVIDYRDISHYHSTIIERKNETISRIA